MSTIKNTIHNFLILITLGGFTMFALFVAAGILGVILFALGITAAIAVVGTVYAILAAPFVFLIKLFK